MRVSNLCRKKIGIESFYILKYMFVTSPWERQSNFNNLQFSNVSVSNDSRLHSARDQYQHFDQREYKSIREYLRSSRVSNLCRIENDSRFNNHTQSECDSNNIISINFINENIFKLNTTSGGYLALV